PGRLVGAALAERILIGCLVVLPVGSLLPVAGRDLPGFVRVPLARQQTLLLFIKTDVEEEFKYDGAVIGEQLLEVVDLVITPTPDLLRHKIMDARNQHIFIVRTIENAHDPSRWRDLVNAPEEIVL